MEAVPGLPHRDPARLAAFADVDRIERRLRPALWALQGLRADARRGLRDDERERLDRAAATIAVGLDALARVVRSLEGAGDPEAEGPRHA